MVHSSQSSSHSRISLSTSTHHRPLARPASTTQINSSLPQSKRIDDTRLRGGSLSIRSPRRHPVIVDDDVTLSRISTLIRSADSKQIDNSAASYNDVPFRAISNAINKEIRKEKVPRSNFFRVMDIDKDMEKDKVQGKVIEPEGQVINIGRPPSDCTPWYLRPQYADQLYTDDKGNVRSGSLLSLFEMLTFPPHPTSKLYSAQVIYASGTDELAGLAQYKTFTNVFLMTFRTFTTADDFFNMLAERFHVKPNGLLTDSEYLDWKANFHTPVQRLVLEIFSRWLENYKLFEEEPHIAQRLKKFLTLIVSSPHNKTATIIINTIDRMVRWTIRLSVLLD